MSTPEFNPAHSIQFDLARGTVSRGGNAPRVLLPAEAVLNLCQSAGADAQRDFGHSLGTEIGRQVSERLGDAIQSASVAQLVDHLGGELALSGLGNFGVEQWGQALVITIQHCPLGAQGDALLCSIIEGVAQRGLSRNIVVVPIWRQDESVRLLVTSEAGAAKVRQWLDQGRSYGDVLGYLNAAAQS